jgi:hypothetical protein
LIESTCQAIEEHVSDEKRKCGFVEEHKSRSGLMSWGHFLPVKRNSTCKRRRRPRPK